VAKESEAISPTKQMSVAEECDSVFQSTQKIEEDYQPPVKEKQYKVKSLNDILGADAEKKLNIKLFDAPKFFDKDEEKEEIDEVL
jgi:hypothetical protein